MHIYLNHVDHRSNITVTKRNEQHSERIGSHMLLLTASNMKSDFLQLLMSNDLQLAYIFKKMPSKEEENEKHKYKIMNSHLTMRDYNKTR